MTQQSLSIIIPTFNEEENIVRCLGPIVNVSSVEVIVSDGGSTDRTIEIAGRYSEVKVVSSTKGRGVQMNKGASIAQGDVFLFLHADCVLSKETILNFRKRFEHDSIIGGAFKIKLLSDKFQYRLIEMGINFRSRVFKLPYGDQGLFVEKSVFKELGGFREMDACEDLDFICRLKKHGGITILNEEIFSSVRRWKKNGILRTSFRNQILLALYLLGLRYFNHRYQQRNTSATKIDK